MFALHVVVILFFRRREIEGKAEEVNANAQPNNSFNRSANSAVFIRQLEGLLNGFRARLIRALGR
jgi:hypothetical protein